MLQPLARATVKSAFAGLILGGVLIFVFASITLAPRIRVFSERMRLALASASDPLPEQSSPGETVFRPAGRPGGRSVSMSSDQPLPGGDAALARELAVNITPGASDTASDQPAVSTEDFVLRTSLEAVVVARSARKRGDMQLALDKLREAQALAPDNPEVLAEIASTFEQMGIADKAIAHWRLVYQIGPRGGMYFRLANDKLTNGINVVPGSPQASRMAAAQTGDGTAEQEIAMSRETSKLVIESAKSAKTADENGLAQITLRLFFRAKEPPITAKDVKVQVFFYDILNDQDVVLTDAETVSEWVSKPVNWVNGSIEELQVDYQAPVLNAEESQGQERKYLGYVVLLYYNNELQDVGAEPRRLIDLYPPPLTLENEQ